MRLKKDSKIKDLDFTYSIFPKEEVITPNAEDQAEHKPLELPKRARIDPGI